MVAFACAQQYDQRYCMHSATVPARCPHRSSNTASLYPTPVCVCACVCVCVRVCARLCAHVCRRHGQSEDTHINCNPRHTGTHFFDVFESQGQWTIIVVFLLIHVRLQSHSTCARTLLLTHRTHAQQHAASLRVHAPEPNDNGVSTSVRKSVLTSTEGSKGETMGSVVSASRSETSDLRGTCFPAPTSARSHNYNPPAAIRGVPPERPPAAVRSSSRRKRNAPHPRGVAPASAHAQRQTKDSRAPAAADRWASRVPSLP